MAKYDKKKDYKIEEPEQLYRLHEQFMEELSERPFVPRTKEEEEREEREFKPIVKHRALPRLEEEKVQPLRRLPPMVIGGLFDRLRFLTDRIKETEDTMTARGDLHKQMLEEIAQDLQERESMMSHVTDADERRNLKLDMSVLRKERRHEQVQFWRDLLELRTELRELFEKHQTEKKIVDLFGHIKADLGTAVGEDT